MRIIVNKTARPIKVPLPRGKVVHLGPHKTGEIANNAVEHPPLVKLVEAGDIELGADGVSKADPRKAAAGSVSTSNSDHHPAAGPHRSGDR